jgi:hypothetical protein
MNKKTFLVQLALLFSIATTAQQKVLVKGYITSTEDYCNGARPSEEMLQDLATEKPIANKIIYLKTSLKNPKCTSGFTKVKTDEHGRFEVLLKSGTEYYFVEEWKAKAFVAPKNTRELTWDLKCLRERYNTADFVLKVSNSNNQVHINYHKPCNFKPYCGSFSGPLPP